MDMIIASGKFGVIIKLCQRILDGEECQRNEKRVLSFQSLKERGM